MLLFLKLAKTRIYACIIISSSVFFKDTIKLMMLRLFGNTMIFLKVLISDVRNFYATYQNLKLQISACTD